jgi:hypothetical protein
MFTIYTVQYLHRGGRILFIIKARRKWFCSDLPQGGLEVPCSYCFSNFTEDSTIYKLDIMWSTDWFGCLPISMRQWTRLTFTVSILWAIARLWTWTWIVLYSHKCCLIYKIHNITYNAKISTYMQYACIRVMGSVLYDMYNWHRKTWLPYISENSFFRPKTNGIWW